jgi:hypothetical protein
MRSSSLAFSARAGLMWPSVSLEHEGADWHVKDSITPSAINSWIGEEVRPVAAEASISATAGDHKLRATAALMAANDTSGTLLTFRGWALHDRTTLAFHRQPLPPLDEPVAFTRRHTPIRCSTSAPVSQAAYAKLSWQPPVPIPDRAISLRQSHQSRGRRRELEWGWRTAFNHIGLAGDLGGGAEFKAQALQGRTRMGYREPTERWINNRFRSAFVLLTRPFGSIQVTARTDAFDTQNRGSDVGDEYDDSGWSAMIAAKRDWTHFTGLVELLHVSSKREDREEAGLEPRQRQTQLQAEVRMHW